MLANFRYKNVAFFKNFEDFGHLEGIEGLVV